MLITVIFFHFLPKRLVFRSADDCILLRVDFYGVFAAGLEQVLDLVVMIVLEQRMLARGIISKSHAGFWVTHASL